VLSPWIRRALVAGGFGTGEPSSNIPDIAAVTPHGEDSRELPYVHQDIESSVITTKRDQTRTPEGGEPVIATITPFFHVDLVSAVKAAESGADSDSIDFEKLKV
jgi:sodium-independent sulfate anion transporter 11